MDSNKLVRVSDNKGKDNIDTVHLTYDPSLKSDVRANPTLVAHEYGLSVRYRHIVCHRHGIYLDIPGSHFNKNRYRRVTVCLVRCGKDLASVGVAVNDPYTQYKRKIGNWISLIRALDSYFAGEKGRKTDPGIQDITGYVYLSYYFGDRCQVPDSIACL